MKENILYTFKLGFKMIEIIADAIVKNQLKVLESFEKEDKGDEQKQSLLGHKNKNNKYETFRKNFSNSDSINYTTRNAYSS